MTVLARPLVVLSDLHLSHGATAATSQALSELLERHPGHEVVLAGDIFNLSLDPPERDALESLRTLLGPELGLLSSLRKHVNSGGALTLIAGNHDAETADPKTRELLLGMLELQENAPIEVATWFVRRNGVHIEHGHFYDPDNAPTHPLALWSRRTEPLGVALTRRFLAPNEVYAFAHAHETTPLAGIAKAFRIFGPRAPILIARYFATAAKLCVEAVSARRFSDERLNGERLLENFAEQCGVSEMMLRALLEGGPLPTHHSLKRTFMRLYFDRVLATLAVTSGGTARLFLKSGPGGALAALGALYLIASVRGSGNRYADLPVERLRLAAESVRDITGVETVIFGHTHHEDEVPGYVNCGSFTYTRARRPYALVNEHGNVERHSLGCKP